MNIGDLVCIHGSYNHTDENGVKHSNVYLDVSHSYEQLKVTPPRPKFLVPLKTPGVLLEVVDLDAKGRADFKWAKVMFPQGIGYVSLALLRSV
jgi:hypothetical protein